MSKMDLHDLFGYLKHKLWPKKGHGVKLPIWLPTTKSWESPWLTCIQVVCHISLKSSQQGLQLCFKPHFNQRSTQEFMGLQSCGSPNLGNFGTPNLGVLEQNDIWVQAPWPGIENIISEKVVASPKSRPWWILWIHVYMRLIHAPKMLQLRTNQLIVWFVHVRVNNWPTSHFS